MGTPVTPGVCRLPVLTQHTGCALQASPCCFVWILSILLSSTFCHTRSIIVGLFNFCGESADSLFADLAPAEVTERRSQPCHRLQILNFTYSHGPVIWCDPHSNSQRIKVSGTQVVTTAVSVAWSYFTMPMDPDAKTPILGVRAPTYFF